MTSTTKEKKLRLRTTIFGFIPLPFLDERLEVGQEVVLMDPLPKTMLDFLADGELLRHTIYVHGKNVVSNHTTIKTTDLDSFSEFCGEPATVSKSEILTGDQINEANIMFARGILATITGSSRKVKWI